MIGLAIGLLPIVIAAFLGWLVLQALGGSQFATRQWTLAYPIGSGLLTFALFCSSWAGIVLELTSVILVALVLMAAAAAFAFLPRARRERTRGRPADPRVHRSFQPGWSLLLAVTGLLVVAALAVSVARSYSSWDGMGIWSVKGYGIAREGTIRAGADWGSHGLTYPLNLPLQISMFEMVNGDWLPHSKLISPLYYLALLAGVLAFLRRRVHWPVAGLVSLLIGTAPIVFDQATNGYANLAFSTYLLLGLLALLEGATSSIRPVMWTGGLLLGLATWTRPEGLYLALAGSCSVWVASRFSRMRTSPVSAWAVPILVLGLPWMIFSVAGGSQETTADAAQKAWDSWKQLDFHLTDLYRILRYLGWQATRIEFWGLSIPALGLAAIVARRWMGFGLGRLNLPILASAVGVFLTVVGYFYLAGFQSDVEYLLSTSVERVAMPGMMLGLVWLGSLLPVNDIGTNVPSRDRL